jgi:SNF2 family DNA or RNA helicase
MIRLGLHQFIEKFRDNIIERVAQDSKPLYRPAQDRKEAYELIKHIPRRPIACQIDAVGGIVKALRSRDSAILVGEMGLGKTYISIAASSALGYTKTLVICPPHLVGKWKREVKLTLPSARVEIAEKIADIERALRLRREPLFVILSREKAKLGYYWKGHARKLKDSTLVCPKCCTVILDRDEVPLIEEALNKKRRKCKNCQEPLWEADGKGPRRYPLATYLKNKHPRCFDVLVSDECHEFKGAATAQGIALDHLGKAAKKVLALTGTLLGGYSSNLFYLLYRIAREIQREFRFKDIKKWMELYGVLEKITYISNEEEGRASLKKAQEVRWNERPGISPALIPELLPKTIFLKLSDLNIALPPFRELTYPVDMEEEQKAAYKAFQEDLLSELRAALHQGSRKLLGKYLQALLGYSDSPWIKETINDGNRVIAESIPLKEDKLYPKEIELVRICQEAKKAGRKTVVYAIHTNTRDLTERLRRILEENDLRADILRASKIRPKKREEWIHSSRADVLITHPRNVQTGLDLIDFPEIVWFQQDYSIYILRQASRRSWRIGQTKAVNVHYLFYKNSIQEKAIRLNVQKLRAALLTEGDLVEEGLVNQAEEDGLISLAKAIISQSNEKASLESELERIRTLRDQSDFILPEQDSLQGPPEEKTQIQLDKPAQLEKAETVKPALPQLPGGKRPAAKGQERRVVSTQLALFSFEDLAG